MCDSKKTKKALIEELQNLRSHVAELEKVQAHHRKTEGKLKQYQFMVESAYDVIFSKDLKSRYIIANNKTLEAFGLSRAQVIGKNDHEIMPNKEEARKNIEDDRLIFKTGKLTEISKHMTGTDGKERWFQAVKVPQFDDKGNIVGLVGIARDITEHKKAEEALHDKTRALDAIITNLKQGIAYLDENDTIIYLNQQCADLFGLKYEDVFKKNIYGFHSPKKRGAVRALIKEFKEGRKYLNVVETIGNKVIDNTFHRIQDGDGNYQGILMSAVDITEHKKAEEELLFKSTLLQAQFETSIDGILVVDSEGKSISFNKNFGRMWNIPQQILDTRDDEKMLQYVLDQLKNPGLFLEKVKYLYTHKNEKSRDEIQFKDGRVFDRYSSPLLDSNDKYYGRVWYFRDITEQKKAEEALRESEERHKALFEGAAEGILVVDSETKRFRYANPAACKMLGYTEERLTQMGVRDVHPKESLDHVISEFDAQAKGEKTLAPNIPCLRKDGTIMYADVNTALVLINRKQCNVGFFTDITDRRKAEEALQKARDELEIRVEQRTAELAKANEELRNEITERKKGEEKLHIYQKQLRSLASELSLAEERMRRQIATDVHDHISQNLAISKIKLESLGEFAFLSEPGKTLNEVRDLIAQTIESARSLTFELSPPVLYELGFEAAVVWLIRQARRQYGLSTEFKDDKRPKPLNHNVRVLLFQAVRELLVNVAKHAQARNVTVSARRVRDEIHVSVEDDGVGFDVSLADSRAYETGGFGLFSIRERLGHIGGRLNIESRPGHGTRVTLTAPIDHQEEKGEEKRK